MPEEDANRLQKDTARSIPRLTLSKKPDDILDQ